MKINLNCVERVLLREKSAELPQCYLSNRDPGCS